MNDRKVKATAGTSLEVETKAAADPSREADRSQSDPGRGRLESSRENHTDPNDLLEDPVKEGVEVDHLNDQVNQCLVEISRKEESRYVTSI